MTIEITASSRVGRIRKNNEDMILVGQQFVRDAELSSCIDLADSDRYLLALADGMGGYNGGEIASSEVLHNLQYFFSDMPVGLSASLFNEAIVDWLSSINTVLESKGFCESQLSHMGTTLVALAYYGGNFFWMNCGDSRIYYLSPEKQLTQITTDHSLNTLIGDTDHSNIVTNCIGGGCRNSFIDIVKCTQLVQPGSQFLICSDGLSDMLDDVNIEAMMTADDTDATKLCLAAEDAGGYDNVSVILAKVK